MIFCVIELQTPMALPSTMAFKTATESLCAKISRSTTSMTLFHHAATARVALDPCRPTALPRSTSLYFRARPIRRTTRPFSRVPRIRLKGMPARRCPWSATAMSRRAQSYRTAAGGSSTRLGLCWRGGDTARHGNHYVRTQGMMTDP